MAISDMNLPQLMVYAREKGIAVDGADSREEVLAIVQAAEQSENVEDYIVTVEYEGITVNVPTSVMQDYSFIRALVRAQRDINGNNRNNAEVMADTIEMIDSLLGDQWDEVEKKAREKFGYVPMDFMTGLFTAIMEEMQAKNS